MITFAHPWLLLVGLLPLALARVLPAHREQRDAVRVPFLARISGILGREPTTGGAIRRRNRLQQAMLLVGWVGLVVALARPQWLEDPITRILPSRDLLLAVDLSGSMEHEDFTDDSGAVVTRLTAVKQVLDDFLSRREGDRVGLIFFGSAAFVQAPFTDDLALCRKLLDDARVRMAGPKTVIGDAIGLALTMFEESEVEDRVLILLTDGNDTFSQIPPEKAAGIAADREVTIFTVAVGDPTAVGEEALDEESLEKIAEVTGGAFYRATDRTALDSVCRALDQFDTKELATESYRPVRDLFQWPLGAVLLFVLGGQLLMGVGWWLRIRKSEAA
jgi:Ca-activated chloride channel family protein